MLNPLRLLKFKRKLIKISINFQTALTAAEVHLTGGVTLSIIE
jgi:hypothetical protein